MFELTKLRTREIYGLCNFNNQMDGELSITIGVQHVENAKFERMIEDSGIISLDISDEQELAVFRAAFEYATIYDKTDKDTKDIKKLTLEAALPEMQKTLDKITSTLSISRVLINNTDGYTLSDEFEEDSGLLN